MADQLASIRANVFYEKQDNGEFTPNFEVVMLINKTNYRLSNEGQTIRERALSEQRFFCNKESMIRLSEILKDLAERGEEVLEKNEE